MKKVISFGGGVQSSAMVLLACENDEKAENFKKIYGQVDEVIFADTMREPYFIYDQIELLKKYCNNKELKFTVVSRGDLGADEKQRVPFYTNSQEDNGYSILKRSCTEEYKIVPIRRYMKKQWGGQAKVMVLIGISIDESHRARQSSVQWATNRWPLIELGMNRQDCINYVQKHIGFVPQKSSCYFCPFHNNNYWSFLAKEHPDVFEDACKYDEKIRNFFSNKENKNFDKNGKERKYYLHNSLKPLRDIDFKSQTTLDFGFGCFCDT